jgi:C4-dicarboxylate-specific signal transduction histidine kinase
VRAAPIPLDDTKRLQKLYSYSVLETPPEPSFDAITQAASILFGVPIALVSLVDEKRQWFKSSVGLAAKQTPRDISFCGHAVAQKKTLVVPDASADARFQDNPLVLGPPHVRFYAGAPLITSTGEALGTLCILDTRPQEISSEKLKALELLAQQTVDQLELRKILHLTDGSAKHAEQQNLQTQTINAQLTCLISHLRCGLVAQDTAGNIIFSNRNLPPLVGEALVWKKAAAFHEWMARSSENPDFYRREVVQTIEKCGEQQGIEFKLLDGTMLRCDVIPVTDKSGCIGHLCTFDNVTAEKHAEQIIDAQKAAMARTAKLSAIGEMAGGIAHEINNPLAIIQAKAGLLCLLGEEGTLNSGAVTSNANAICEVVTRISKIVRGLKTLSRDTSGDDLVETSIDQIIDDTLSFCREHLKDKGIELRIEIRQQGLKALCRPAQVSEVLLNLLNNAADAVEKSPTKWISVIAQQFGDRSEIRVADSGPGVPVSLRDRIFTPFVTTKEPGKGTGLGLSVSRAIVEGQKGNLYLDDKEAQTTFVISLSRRN